jgi:N6-adenosine-specific RNA methylase IME4
MIDQFDGEFEIMDTVPDQKIKYSTVVIDPPWMERGGGKIKRGADKHYELLDTPGIVRTVIQSPIWDNVDEHAHMYLWVTNSFLPHGLEVMKALGFRYITNVAWVKNQIGLGQYFRGKHELCLFGTRGRGVLPRTDDRSIPSIIEAKKTGHSRKPDAFYRMVEKRSHGPYVDMFSRRRRDGWSTWGDDLEDET